MSIFLEFNRLITETTERLMVPKGKLIVLINPSLNSLMNTWEASEHNLRGLSYQDGTTVWWPAGMATHEQVESRIPNYGKTKYGWYLGDGGEGRAMLFVSRNSNRPTGDGDMNRLTGGSKLLRTMAFSPKVVTEGLCVTVSESKAFRYLENPSLDELYEFLLISSHQQVRGFTYGQYDSYWWDSNDAVHSTMRNMLMDQGQLQVTPYPWFLEMDRYGTAVLYDAIDVSQSARNADLNDFTAKLAHHKKFKLSESVTEAMTPAQAVKVFLTHGVDTRGMDKEAIRKARTRIALKGKVHPDRGGSTELAQELNAATDILMAQPQSKPQAAPAGFQDFKPKQAGQGKPQPKQPGFEPFKPAQVYRDVKRGPRTGNVWKA